MLCALHHLVEPNLSEIKAVCIDRMALLAPMLAQLSDCKLSGLALPHGLNVSASLAGWCTCVIQILRAVQALAARRRYSCQSVTLQIWKACFRFVVSCGGGRVALLVNTEDCRRTAGVARVGVAFG